VSDLSDRAVASLRTVVEQPEILAGRYEVMDVIGRGGMGVVYRAHDPLLGRDVAIKVLNVLSENSDSAAILRREARVLARLQHPGIVPIYDAGEFDDGRIFYVMRLVRGTTLAKVTATGETLGNLMRHFLRACEAIDFAHGQGIVHRDLKPGNIMIGAQGETVILDWGIAALSNERDAGVLSAGTPGFAAPEQLSVGTQADVRTDVYGLGQILLGILAAQGNTAPRALMSIARSATAAEPGDRYASAAELTADVRRWMDREAVLRHRETGTERFGRLYLRYQPLILLLLAYAVMRVAFFLWRGI
jgi:serine/threonine protein kinase